MAIIESLKRYWRPRIPTVLASGGIMAGFVWVVGVVGLLASPSAELSAQVIPAAAVSGLTGMAVAVALSPFYKGA